MIHSPTFPITVSVIGNIGECINEGYATIYPEITIEGEGSDFKILNQTTGEQLNLNLEIKTGDSIYVDCRPGTRTIKVNEESKIKYKSGEYLSLINGSNQLKVEYTGSCVVYVRWREAWI